MQTTSWLAAAVQLSSGEDVERNVAEAEALVRNAARLGARFVALPENFAYLRVRPDAPEVRIGLDHPVVVRMQALARELGIDLVLGSIPEPSAVAGKVHNTSVYIDSAGAVRGTYRKLHLFDIDIPGAVSARESDTITPGAEPCLVGSDLGPIGLSICYDLRFPELYRRLRADGARVLLVPAAFTLHTGKDHWFPLLRARAIENQCWVVAPAQYGTHGPGRSTYGKATIIDPWGLPVATARDGVGLCLAEIDYDHQDRIRAGLPCHGHRHKVFWG